MGRGLGHVERAIVEAFRHGDNFDTAELCRRVYVVQVVEKKHRVAVLRAVHRLAGTVLPDLWVWFPEHEKTDAVWYDHRRLPLRGRSRHAVDRR